MINPPLSGKRLPMAGKNPLGKLYRDNFALYYQAHLYHLNVIGPDFGQLHDLFGEIYDTLWKWHDTFGELIRQDGDFVKTSLKEIADESTIPTPLDPSIPGKLSALCDGLDILLDLAYDAYKTGDPAIETAVGDYCVEVKKLKWKVDATKAKV